jgi:two-component system, LuxR family, response regulator FixJ
MFCGQTIYVVDDDKPALDSLSLLLTVEGYAVRSHESAATFLDAIKQNERGCVITDARMPGMSGLDLLAVMKERRVSMPVIVVTGYGDVPLAVEAMKRGAIDFFEKPLDAGALLASLRSALMSENEICPSNAERRIPQKRFATLSKREKEVLAGLVKGQPNKNIAHELGISPRTVEVHRANLMKRMQAESLPELVKMALAIATNDLEGTA